MCNLSANLTEDLIEYALAFADVPTLRTLKGVSRAWRARARRVLCARLCARFGLPLTSHLVEVTELTFSHRREPHTLIPDAVDASLALPNLAKVTWALKGFEVNVAKLKCVASSGPDSYPMEEVRACITCTRRCGFPIRCIEAREKLHMLLAACALRHGEARVPAYAFIGNTSMLTSIHFPDGLTSIGKFAFTRCTSLISIQLPTSLTSLGESAFMRCTSLISIELQHLILLTSLGEGAFRDCSSLRSIKLPAGLTSLGDGAFSGCSSLISIELQHLILLTSLGDGAFSGCSSLTSIELPAGLTDIGSCSGSPFHPAGKSGPDLGRLLGIVSDNGSCSGSPLLVLHTGTFEGCTSLTSIQLPASLTSLGDCAFEGCSSLTSIELPASLTNIGSCAFRDCSSLTQIASVAAGLILMRLHGRELGPA